MTGGRQPGTLWCAILRAICFLVKLLTCGLRTHRQHLARHLQAVNLDQHVVQLAAARGLKDQLAVADQAEAAFRVGQRVAGDDLQNVPGLGGSLFEELEAGRHVGEQVLHGDHRAGRPALGLRGSRSWPSATRNSVPAGSIGRCGQQRHLGHRADAGQRLTAKTERGEMIQVAGGRDLAGRMALKEQGRLGRRDAAAVVLNADQPATALADLHAIVGRARIQAVLYQLLDREAGRSTTSPAAI